MNPKFPTFGKLDLPPTGRFPGVCLTFKEQIVALPNRFKPGELKNVPMLLFLFGFVDFAGRLYLAQTGAMMVKTDPHSTLTGFLTKWLGQPPAEDYDRDDLKGRPAMLTITYRKGGDGLHAAVTAALLPKHMAEEAPLPDLFVPFMVTMRVPIPLAFQTGALCHSSRLAPRKLKPGATLFRPICFTPFTTAPTAGPKAGQELDCGHPGAYNTTTCFDRTGKDLLYE